MMAMIMMLMMKDDDGHENCTMAIMMILMLMMMITMTKGMIMIMLKDIGNLFQGTYRIRTSHAQPLSCDRALSYLTSSEFANKWAARAVRDWHRRLPSANARAATWFVIAACACSNASSFRDEEERSLPSAWPPAPCFASSPWAACVGLADLGSARSLPLPADPIARPRDVPPGPPGRGVILPATWPPGRTPSWGTAPHVLTETKFGCASPIPGVRC